MKHKYRVIIVLNKIFFVLLVLFQPSLASEDWSCLKTLDKKTKAKLLTQDRFFYSLHDLPLSFYNKSSYKQKREIAGWLSDLKKGVSIQDSAAYLGMVRDKRAVSLMEKKLIGNTLRGRSRWIITRALAQIASESSKETFDRLLSDEQADTHFYAKVGLAEISSRPQQGSSNAPILTRKRTDTKGTSETLSPNKRAIKKLVDSIDGYYSYKDINNVSWESLFKKYTPMLEKSKSSMDFGLITAKILAHAEDPHIRLRVGNKYLSVGKSYYSANYDIGYLKKKIPNYSSKNSRVSTGLFKNSIGYIMINTWKIDNQAGLKPAFDALKTFKHKKLIIDVRPNSGGSETLAQQFAGCFIQSPKVYAKHITKNPHSNNGWSKVYNRAFKPNKKEPFFDGQVVVLMGNRNMSSCESFLLMMKQVKGCTLIGDVSRGSSGNPKLYELGNGVGVFLPSWKALRLDETCFEGEGLKPDILIETDKSELKRKDKVLEAALKLLNRKKS
ncbi:MAG: hypothetical protein HQL32_09195 [Planctomycetes bacterium]|nr:hypothetical protein [Planctomycetota bacterium]